MLLCALGDIQRRAGRRTVRQLNRIVEGVRTEVERQLLVVRHKLDVFQQVIVRLAHGELDEVIFLRHAVLSQYVDACRTVDTAVEGCDRLIRQLTDRIDIRHDGNRIEVLVQTVERVDIIELVRRKAWLADTVDKDVFEEGVATGLAVIGDRIERLVSALGFHAHLLVIRVGVLNEHALARTGLHRHFRQFGAVVEFGRVVEGVRIETVHLYTVRQQVQQRSVGVGLHGISHDVLRPGTALRLYQHFPLAFLRLTEEHHLAVVFRLVGHCRQFAACFEGIMVLGLVRRKALDKLCTCSVILIDSRQRVLRRRDTREGHLVGSVVVFLVRDKEHSRLVFPQDMYVRHRLAGLVADLGTLAGVRTVVVKRGRRENTFVFQRLTADEDIFQTHRCRRYGDEVDRIFRLRTILRLDVNLRISGGVRCGDRHLLAFRSLDSYGRTGSCIQYIFVFVFVGLEARQGLAAYVDHLQLGTGSRRDDELDLIRPSGTALRLDGDTDGLAVPSDRYVLRGFACLRRHLGQLRRPGLKNLRVLGLVRIETFQLRAVEVDHLQGGVVRLLIYKMDYIRATCAITRADGDLVIAVQTRRTTNHRVLVLLVLQHRLHLRKRRRAVLSELHPVLVDLRVKRYSIIVLVLQAVAVADRQALERVVRIGIHRELDAVGRRAAVARGHGDTRRTVQTAIHRLIDFLIRIACHTFHYRHGRRTYRQLVLVVRAVRTEIRKRLAIDKDVRQIGVVRLRGREIEFIDRLVAVACLCGNTDRSIDYTCRQRGHHRLRLVLVALHRRDLR